MQDILRNLKETFTSLTLKPDIAIYISYRYNIKHLYNIQIQKYISNEKIIQNYAQMKYKWPVTAIKDGAHYCYCAHLLRMPRSRRARRERDAQHAGRADWFCPL